MPCAPCLALRSRPCVLCLGLQFRPGPVAETRKWFLFRDTHLSGKAAGRVPGDVSAYRRNHRPATGVSDAACKSWEPTKPETVPSGRRQSGRCRSGPADPGTGDPIEILRTFPSRTVEIPEDLSRTRNFSSYARGPSTTGSTDLKIDLSEIRASLRNRDVASTGTAPWSSRQPIGRQVRISGAPIPRLTFTV